MLLSTWSSICRPLAERRCRSRPRPRRQSEKIVIDSIIKHQSQGEAKLHTTSLIGSTRLRIVFMRSVSPSIGSSCVLVSVTTVVGTPWRILAHMHDIVREDGERLLTSNLPKFINNDTCRLPTKDFFLSRRGFMRGSEPKLCRVLKKKAKLFSVTALEKRSVFEISSLACNCIVHLRKGRLVLSSTN